MHISYTRVLLAAFGTGAILWLLQRSLIRTTQETLDSNQNQPVNGIADSTAPVPIVRVGSKSILLSDLDAEISIQLSDLFRNDEYEFSSGTSDTQFEQKMIKLREAVLSQLIERKVLMENIYSDTGFDVDNPSRYVECLKDWKEASSTGPNKDLGPLGSAALKVRQCEKSLIEQYAKERVFKGISVREEELRQHYAANRSKYVIEPMVTLRQIVLATEDDAKKVQVGLNRSNFAERAKQFSITSEGQSGGRLGPFSHSQIPLLYDIAVNMRRGDIFGIHKTTYGFHLIMLEEKMPKKTPSFEEVRSQIEQELMKKKQAEEYSKWVDSALSHIPINDLRTG